MLKHHPNRPLTNLVGIFRPVARHGSSFSKVGASETPGAVHYPKFNLHHHTQLWNDLGARNPAKAFGVYLKDNDWWWYENWLDRVRLHCDEHNARYA